MWAIYKILSLNDICFSSPKSALQLTEKRRSHDYVNIFYFILVE